MSSKYAEPFPHVDLFQRGYDNHGQSPLIFSGTQVNAKTGSYYEASVPSTFIQDGDMIHRLNVVDGYLQSDNYVEDTSGWRLDADGNIEAESGSFRGDITGASGTFSGALEASSIEIGTNAWHVDSSGNMWWGASETYAGATIKISSAGSVNFTTGTFAGTLSATSGTLGTITAGTITGATITGGTITGSEILTKSVETTGNIRLHEGSYGGQCDVEYGGTQKGFFAANSSVTIFGSADGNDIQINSDDNINIIADDWFQMIYNDNTGDDDFNIFDDSSIVLSLDSGRDATFADDVDIGGTLSKSSGSFRIDHPLKPETHFLFHSFVESPDMMNMYKGRGTITNGKCKIDLPDYFEVLNKDIEYNLTAIGQKINLWISKEVQNNKFEVSGDVDGEFTWVVYGVRQDKYAVANPIIPEVEKEIPGYIRPELFGETQNLLDKIKSENIRRKERGLKPIEMNNKKGFIKKKSKSALDEDIVVKMRADRKTLKRDKK